MKGSGERGRKLLKPLLGAKGEKMGIKSNSEATEWTNMRLLNIDRPALLNRDAESAKRKCSILKTLEPSRKP